MRTASREFPYAGLLLEKRADSSYWRDANDDRACGERFMQRTRSLAKGAQQPAC